MKRWMAWLGVVCAAGLMFSACGGSPTSRETSATAGEAAPLFYFSGDGLYMGCLLYTSAAAGERTRGGFGGRRII